ncbi:class I SAM-dependent methyltransferase [Ekhidna sp.]|jgi:2-polyprenyl-3-methyl-5-hydroxy-6-metoxy-1,4-benzoquinol methylase|uniref:class I SAM-dependent methyltransferase n=1 Tax=Ekhidna sp. TaxID=2608089 RepID=UPI0032F023F5
MNCPLCNSSSSKPVYHTAKIKVLKCRDCNIVFQDTTVLTQELKEYYENRKPRFRPPTIHRHRRQENILIRLRKLNTFTDPILVDIGSGWGSFLHQSKAYFPSQKGIEPNKDQAEYCQRDGIEVLNSMYDTSSLKSNSTELITLIQVLEHVENPKTTLESIYAHLKSGGIAVIDVPSYNNPRFLLYRLSGIKKFAIKDFIVPHVFYYTPKRLIELCEEIGFEIAHKSIGQYSIKTGNFFLKPVDWICNYLGIGSITLFLRK